ncbi:MAG: hypothetical protein AAB796_02800, partial [Patescibacteria group bacterium]
SFPLRFKARRAEGGFGGNPSTSSGQVSARRAKPVPFGYFQTDTTRKEMKSLTRPLYVSWESSIQMTRKI